MRLYNPVSCTPVGTVRGCVSSNWTPKSFLPVSNDTAGQRPHSSPRPSRIEKKVSMKSAILRESLATQPSPQSKSSEFIETTTTTTAPVGESFDSAHCDVNTGMLRNRSPAYTSYSDPSLYAMSSSSTWTTSTSLFHGQCPPFDSKAASSMKDYVKMQKDSSSNHTVCEPPAVVVTPLHESLQSWWPNAAARDVGACEFVKALDRRKDVFNEFASSWKTRVTRRASKGKGLKVPKHKETAVIDTSPRCKGSYEQRFKRPSSNQGYSNFRSDDCGSQVWSPLSPFEKAWTDLQNFVTDEASEFLDDFADWSRSNSPFIPIERPPPAQPTKVVTPFPCILMGQSSEASSSIESETSHTPSSFTHPHQVPCRRNSWQKDYLELPKIRGTQNSTGYHTLHTKPTGPKLSHPHANSRAPRLPMSRTDVSMSLDLRPNHCDIDADSTYRIYRYFNKLVSGVGVDGTTMWDSSHVPMLNRSDFDPDTPLRSPTRHRSEDGFSPVGPYWDAHENINPDTVWGKLQHDFDSDLREIGLYAREFNALFRTDGMHERNRAMSTDKAAPSVIDPKRTNDCDKFLESVNMSLDEIVSAIENMDVTTMTPDQMTGILPYLPTCEEKRDLVAFFAMSATNPKTECEKFMVAMLGIQDAKPKLEAMIFMKIFANCMESIRNDAINVQAACAEIIGDARFRKILGIILALGNRLNVSGTNTIFPAKAIKVESLLKLEETKAVDGKTTFLQWIARIVLKCYPNLVPFIEDMPHLQSAEKLNWSSTLAEFEEFEVQLFELRWLALGNGACGGTDDESCLTIPEEIEKLRTSTVGMFTLGACVQMARVADEIEKAQRALVALARYFGEEEWESHPDELLRVMSVFCNSFDAALRAGPRTETNETSNQGIPDANLQPNRSSNKYSCDTDGVHDSCDTDGVNINEMETQGTTIIYGETDGTI